MAIIKNLTGVNIHLLNKDDEVIKVFKKMTMFCAVQYKHIAQDPIELENFKVPITKTVYATSNLPEPKEGVYYIVTNMTRIANPDRNDFLVPTHVIKNKEGKILGCRSLGISL